MAKQFQVTFDCADPGRLARFWAAVLDYRLTPPPDGFADWTAYWRHVGLPEEELVGDFDDRIEDPRGVGPRFWFQPVPEGKVVKNRLHLDIMVSGGRAVPLPQRRSQVDAEAERLTALGATTLRVLTEPGVDHYGVVMRDPEGNEFCLT